MKLEPNLHHKLCTTITMMIITIIIVINILTSYILTFNLVFEICFGRFLVSCPPDLINCYRILLLSSNSINRFSKRSIIYINIYEKRDKFNILPMDWDFSSLPWEESFLKGGSHFLEKSISFNILRRSSLWWSPCKHLFQNWQSINLYQSLIIRHKRVSRFFFNMTRPQKNRPGQTRPDNTRQYKYIYIRIITSMLLHRWPIKPKDNHRHSPFSWKTQFTLRILKLRYLTYMHRVLQFTIQYFKKNGRKNWWCCRINLTWGWDH